MTLKQMNQDQQIEEVISGIRGRALNLFTTRQLMCSEAVLVVLNQALRGGLPPEMAIGLVSGLPEGLGGGGCTCGALTSGVIALGLFLGRKNSGLFNNRTIMAASRELHDRFREYAGTTCCRVLTKHLNSGSKEHFDQCARHTALVAEVTARLILEKRPELACRADRAYLEQQDSKIGGRLKQIKNTVLSR